MYVTTKNAGKKITSTKFSHRKIFSLPFITNMWLCSFFPSVIAEFDRHEILLYEEVAKVPPFKRKTLILIGAQGVGRRRLKNKLLLLDPHLFGTTIPCTDSQVSIIIPHYTFWGLIIIIILIQQVVNLSQLQQCVCVHYSSLPDTSRKPKKGEHESRMYAFTSRSKMEADIKNGRYLEHGEYNGNLYGIKTDSIHEVVEAGRVCILDANPQVTTR